MEISKNWCFTINNYEEDAVLPLFEKLKSIAKYVVIGREIGESGTRHLQGFVALKDEKTRSAVSKHIPAAHLEIKRGTFAQASVYCMKDGDFLEAGKLPMDQKDKGLKTKDAWAEMVRLAEAQDLQSIKMKYPQEYVQYIGKFKLIAVEANKIPETINSNFTPHEWFCGPPGTGKSRAARVENPDAFIKDPQTKWWDGYSGQHTVIIDDFDKYQKAQGGDMKRWLDRYPFQAEVKNGYKLIRPKKLVVTSNYRPCDIWDDDVTTEAVERRVTIRKFGDPDYVRVWDPVAQGYSLKRTKIGRESVTVIAPTPYVLESVSVTNN